MTLKITRLHLAGGVALALAMITVPAIAYTGQELAKQAKISISEARAIALKAHPGRITDEELEREPGGSGLRYSFDIKRGRVTQEVGVDAQTGKVLENKKEGKNPISGRRPASGASHCSAMASAQRLLSSKAARRLSGTHRRVRR